MSRSRPLWRALGRAVPADWLRDPLRLVLFAAHAAEDVAEDDRAALARQLDLCLTLWVPKEASRRLQEWAGRHGATDDGAREQDPTAAWAANSEHWFMAELDEEPTSGG